MKIVIAPDSFKNSLPSPAVCRAIAAGFRSRLPLSELVELPLADGGEGTTESVVLSTRGKMVKLAVCGPLGTPVEACYGLLGGKKSAVMEMAAASGLELLLPEQLNPLDTTSYGTGELLRGILKSGCREIIIGLGGSATVDAGAGMLQALGFRFLDASGRELGEIVRGADVGRIARIDRSRVEPLLEGAVLTIACDVTSPLLGRRGAAQVFGPQKGATPRMVEQLEENLGCFAAAVKRSGFSADCTCSGDGAAGGLGFSLRVLLGAKMVSGAELLLGLCGLQEHLRGADLLITGEGRSDEQTAAGKLPAAVARAGQQAGVPVVLISGAVHDPGNVLQDLFTAVFSIARGPLTLDEALRCTSENLTLTAASIAGLCRNWRTDGD